MKFSLHSLAWSMERYRKLIASADQSIGMIKTARGGSYNLPTSVPQGLNVEGLCTLAPSSLHPRVFLIPELMTVGRQTL